MVKKITTLVLVLAMIMTAGGSLADLKLNDKTPAQQTLKKYIDNVNNILLESGEEAINNVFDQMDDCVELGITMEDNAYVP